jgi:hypothetical protein
VGGTNHPEKPPFRGLSRHGAPKRRPERALGVATLASKSRAHTIVSSLRSASGCRRGPASAAGRRPPMTVSASKRRRDDDATRQRARGASGSPGMSLPVHPSRGEESSSRRRGAGTLGLTAGAEPLPPAFERGARGRYAGGAPRSEHGRAAGTAHPPWLEHGAAIERRRRELTRRRILDRR